MPDEVEDYELRLGEMQLFVVPITTRLLTKPSRAMDVDVPFAIEHHIPVLTLMQESGVEDLYSRRFGDLQFLEKNTHDPTAIPYEEKLTKYLESVIIGDKLAQQVRDAFDAYIFLSYRKKDRKYAQDLMRLIHQKPFCRDIAIWYDEFLTPGEGFNQAIREALEKSDLFALTVTPNLLEMPGGKPNYVMEHEYPAMKEANRTIIPAEMITTDKTELNKHYTGIPVPVKADNSKELEDRLLQAVQKLAVRTKDTDPQHNFFIGLAYLGGIDVEVNHERAVSLITGSAEQGYIPAIKKLVSMYNNGEGVERDYHKAVKWHEKLVEQRRKNYEETPNEANAVWLIFDLWDLGDAYRALGQLSPAQIAYDEMRRCSEAFSKHYTDKRLVRYQSVSYNKLGNIAEAQGKLSQAEECYRKSLAIAESLAEETNTVESRRDLSVSYEKNGDIAKAQGKLSEAEGWYRKGLAIHESLAKETNTVESRRDLSFSYNKLGDIAKAQGKLNEAEGWYRKGLAIRESLAKETNTVESRRDLSVSYNKLGDIAKARGKLSEAEEWYRKSLAILETLAEETNTVKSRRDLSVSYGHLGDIAKALGKLSEAEEWYRKSLAIDESLAEETNTVESYDDLAVSYYKIGCLLRDHSYLDKALYIWTQLAEQFPDNPSYQQRREVVTEVLTTLSGS